jgi:phosphoglycolate phosphatase/pyrophosphatase PpaX
VVLLDLDGTLINTKRLYIEAYRSAVLPYIGRDLTTEEILALRPRCELRFLRDVVGADRLEPCLADFHQAYAALHPQHFRGIYPGIPEFLATLRAAELTLGIVTGKSRRSWEITRPHAPLGDFDALIFADDVAEPKPDPEGLRIALEQLSADPARAFYLGDSVSDMEAARAAGVRPAAAVWAKKPESRAEFTAQVTRLGATVFDTPADFAREVLSFASAG